MREEFKIRFLLACNRNAETRKFNFKSVPCSQLFYPGDFIQIRFKACGEIILHLAFKSQNHGFRHAGINKSVFDGQL